MTRGLARRRTDHFFILRSRDSRTACKRAPLPLARWVRWIRCKISGEKFVTRSLCCRRRSKSDCSCSVSHPERSLQAPDNNVVELLAAHRRVLQHPYIRARHRCSSQHGSSKPTPEKENLAASERAAAAQSQADGPARAATRPRSSHSHKFGAIAPPIESCDTAAAALGAVVSGQVT